MLNANYYLLDVKSQTQLDQFRGRSMVPNPDIYLDECDGNFQMKTQPQTQSSLSQYYINPSNGEIDPTQFMAKLITGAAHTVQDIQQEFQNYLKTPETKVRAFDFLFANKPRGNGLQILVIYNEDIVTDYGHTICQYLSYEFGCDINFVDPVYRPDVKGNRDYQGNFNYIGDKNRGAMTVAHLKDYKLRMEFDGFILQIHGQMNSKDQLNNRLNVYNVEQLIYLYNLLFPNKPLPPNFYEHEQLKQIIISMVIDHVPQNQFGNNLYTTDHLQSMLEGFERNEKSDFGAEDIYDYLM